jgi:hypothetical protein
MTPFFCLRAAALLAGLSLAAPALAAPSSNTMKQTFGNFTVIGTYDRGACAAQSAMRSARGARVGFSVYWVPGGSLYLLTSHPEAGRIQGAQKVTFVFPSGERMAFNMTRNGNSLYTDIGFGGTARSFYSKLKRAGSLRIEVPGLDDAVSVDLSRRREVEAAMHKCGSWLRS